MSMLVHAGLLMLLLRCAPGRHRPKERPLEVNELVVLVGDDEPKRRLPVATVAPPAGVPAITPVAPLPAPPAARSAVVTDQSPADAAVQAADPAPTVRGRLNPVPANTPRDGDGVAPAPAAPRSETDFFEVAATGRTVVYVLDHSMSMGLHDGLRRARVELLASIRRLPSTALFQVIAYNTVAEPLCVRNCGGLLRADTETLAEVARALAALRPVGLTRHAQALQRGLEFRPDVLFFATDSDEADPDRLTFEQVAAVSRYNGGRCAIHVIGFSNRPDGGDSPLRRLADQNRGTYRRVAVKEL
jgi:hypothetical protein